MESTNDLMDFESEVQLERNPSNAKVSILDTGSSDFLYTNGDTFVGLLPSLKCKRTTVKDFLHKD